MELKIVTYNIQYGKRGQAVVKNIKNLANEGVQVFCLQEVWLLNDGVNITDLLLKELGQEWQAEYFVSDEANSIDYGLCILWKTSALRSISFHRLLFPSVKQIKAWEKLFYFYLGFKARIVKRGALIGTFEIGNQKIRISTTHLDWQGGYSHRTNQMELLKSYLLSGSPISHEVVCGDLNTIGLRNILRLAREIQPLLAAGFKNVFTKPSRTSASRQQLDYIFSKGLTVEEVQIRKFSGSDHFPIQALLTFNSQI